jgi:hypothetical protein
VDMYFSCVGARDKFQKHNHNPDYWMGIWLDHSGRYFKVAAWHQDYSTILHYSDNAEFNVIHI